MYGRLLRIILRNFDHKTQHFALNLDHNPQQEAFTARRLFTFLCFLEGCLLWLTLLLFYELESRYIWKLFNDFELFLFLFLWCEFFHVAFLLFFYSFVFDVYGFNAVVWVAALFYFVPFVVKANDGVTIIKALNEVLIESHNVNFLVARDWDWLKLVSLRLKVISYVNSHIKCIVVVNALRWCHLELGCSYLAPTLNHAQLKLPVLRCTIDGRRGPLAAWVLFTATCIRKRVTDPAHYWLFFWLSKGRSTNAFFNLEVEEIVASFRQSYYSRSRCLSCQW